MTGIRNLPTMAEIQAESFEDRQKRLAKPGKFDRAEMKEAAKRYDERKLREWSDMVRERDQWRDRYDGKRVERTARMIPRRGDAHHIVPRGDQAVRYDVRNGITLAAETHDRVERGELKIEGTRYFTVEGKRYIDATHPVKFIEAKRHGSSRDGGKRTGKRTDGHRR